MRDLDLDNSTPLQPFPVQFWSTARTAKSIKLPRDFTEYSKPLRFLFRLGTSLLMSLNAILPRSLEAAPIFAAKHLRRKQIGMFLSTVTVEGSDLFASRSAAGDVTPVGVVVPHMASVLGSVLQRIHSSIMVIGLTSEMHPCPMFENIVGKWQPTSVGLPLLVLVKLAGSAARVVFQCDPAQAAKEYPQSR